MTIDFFSAFVVGLLGAGHCLGMCGGITSMLTSAVPKSNSSMRWLYSLCYNLGRISSYSLIGAIAGFTGSLAIKSLGVPLTILQVIASVFLILLGLYIGQWFMLLTKIESVGKVIWKYISPITKHVIPVNSAPKALILGALWGWLPCGLVYSTLTWSLASGSAISGALIMLGFGLGTMPALMAFAIGTTTINQLFKKPVFRQVMGFLLICYGFYGLNIAYGVMF